MGASEESLGLLKQEQVDGVSLLLFGNDELRDNFKLSLGVLKKHNENLKRKAELCQQPQVVMRESSNSNNDALREEVERSNREREEMERSNREAIERMERELREAKSEVKEI